MDDCQLWVCGIGVGISVAVGFGVGVGSGVAVGFGVFVAFGAGVGVSTGFGPLLTVQISFVPFFTSKPSVTV